MTSPTPHFDAQLDAIYETLVPHIRSCLWKGKHSHCEGEFEIVAEDIEFIKMLRVAVPHYCPTCRRMRRLNHMNMVYLFKRACDVPEHTETMISIFPSECPFPVYDYQYFIGDQFEPALFATDYVDGSPLEMLRALRMQFPMPSFLNRDPSCINSDYSNGGKRLEEWLFCHGVLRL